MVVNQDSEVIGHKFATDGKESRLNTCVRMAIFLGDLVYYPPEINFTEGSEDVLYVYEHNNPVLRGTYHESKGNHPFFVDEDLWIQPKNSESKYSLWGLGNWIGIGREHECFEEKFLKVCEEGSWEMQLMRFPLILEFMWKSGKGKWYTAMAVYHKPRGLLFRIGNVLGRDNGVLEMKCWSIATKVDQLMTDHSVDEIKGAIAKTLTGKLFPRNTARRGGGTISKCGMNLKPGLKVIDAYCLMIKNPKYSEDAIVVDGPVGGDISGTNDGKDSVESETSSGNTRCESDDSRESSSDDPMSDSNSNDSSSDEASDEDSTSDYTPDDD